MPVYNAAPFLEACLKSIIGQSYGQWELLAVDDGSTDESLSILRVYEKKDPRISVISNRHSGIIEALKDGFKASEGALICRMDADDRMPKHKLKWMQAAWSKKGLGHLVTGKVQYFSADTLGDGYKKYTAWINTLVDQQNHFAHIFRECVIPSCVWMLHRKDFLLCGGFESELYPEDYDLCFRFFQNNIEVIALDKELHFWRDHPSRSSRTDPNYRDNRFLELKLHYFTLLFAKSKMGNFVVWGAGKKGKEIAQFFIDHRINFNWITNNKKKIGKHIYGKKLLSSNLIHDNSQVNINAKYIIAVANPAEQIDICNALTNQDLEEGKDFFFFA